MITAENEAHIDRYRYGYINRDTCSHSTEQAQTSFTLGTSRRVDQWRAIWHENVRDANLHTADVETTLSLRYPLEVKVL